MASWQRGTTLLVEQRRRWQQGDPVRVEAFLEQHPEARDNVEQVLELIYNEVVLREEKGELPRLEEYLQRFPQLDVQLRLQFELHQALQAERLPPTSVQEGVPAGGDPAQRTGTDGDAIPGYEVLGELGRGGMGVVYRARQTSLHRIVALKMILAGQHASPATRARFRTEAEAVARLQHPHIVQIYEVGEHQARPFFSLEFVEGGSLDRQLAGTPQAVDAAAQLVEALARAMHHAHEHGIIHRDLKPSNVLLAPGDALQGVPLGDPAAPQHYQPKITDFGLAKVADAASGPTPTEAFLGTPNYMAPEQATGRARAISPLSDVYSLGAILYELLTGRPPFRGATVLDTLEQVRSQEPVPPARLQPKTPRDLETICLKCLEKDPKRRYASAADLADDLRRFRASEPIRARPGSAAQRLRKWARRRPAVAALLGVSTLAALSLLAFFVWHHFDLRAKVEEATASERRASTRERRAQLEKQNLIQRQLDEKKGRLAAQDKFRQFIRRRDGALFTAIYAKLFPGSDRAQGLEASKRLARQALTLGGVDADRETVPAPDPFLSASERAEVSASCYELLLFVAEAEARTPTREPATARRHAERALRYLALATRFGPLTRAYHLRRARYLGRVGDAPGLLRERRRAERLRPDSAIDYFLLGDEHFQQGQPARAARDFEEALNRQPDHFWARYYLAACHLLLQRPAEARVALTACLARRPDFIWTYLLRGFVLTRLHDYRAAADDFRRAEQMQPDGPARYVLFTSRGVMRFELDRVFLTGFAASAWGGPASPGGTGPFLAAAAWLNRNRNLGEAAGDLRRAIALRPNNYHGHVTLARVYRSLGREKLAAEQVDQAKLLPLPGQVLADLCAEQGRALCQGAEYEAAVAACDAALRLCPEHADAHVWRGQALLKLHRLREAAGAFDRYFRHSRETDVRAVGNAYRWRGQVRVGLGDFLGARDDYTRALLLQPDADIYTHRGWAYFFADAWRPALRDFDRAIRLDAAKGDAYTGRGLARVMLGRPREAFEDAGAALRLRPDTPEMMHNVACIYALAVDQVDRAEGDPARRQALAQDYRRRAVEVVQKTLALLRPQERGAFWRRNIFPDPALRSIHACEEFKKLVKQYAGP
jgi:tetratricopeptide (TPR) repeat protein/tRNA A-37 threonylcarbamoyl transferase component Bud32